MATQLSREKAAQAWCKPSTSSKQMDPELAEAFAEILDQSNGPDMPPMNGFKFEHILISVTIAHNRAIGQFDDSCAHQIEKAMKEYQGILMVDAQVQYQHGQEQQHAEKCECGLCQRVRDEIQEAK